MGQPVNTLASIATYATLIAVLQASAPSLRTIVASGTATREELFDLGYTVVLTVLAIAAKHKENPVEYTPKWLIGMSRAEALENAGVKDRIDENVL